MSDDQEVHPETLSEKPPLLIFSVYDTVTHVLSTYGWFLLGGVVLGLYFWHNFLAGWYSVWVARREDREYAARYHKDPDMERARQEQIERARRKMQEESDRKAAAFAERQQAREEALKLEKEAERARLNGETGGRRLRDGVDPTAPNNQSGSKPSFKPDYNPLMGSGSGSYRAPKRGGCPGGSCNR